MHNSIEKKTKAEIAAEKLEAAIVDCRIAPGAVMTETEVSEYLDIGRTPVREALMKLANENLVRLSRAGVVIPELNPLTMLKLLEPRALIEQLCIEKAVERITVEDKVQINIIIDALQGLSNEDRKGFMAVLQQIHDILAQSSKNEFILASIKTTQGLSRRFWCYYATDKDQNYCIKLYIRQMQALLNQDEKEALGASAELVKYLQDFTKAQLEPFK
ncbi:GntR family transcriptional regulator [Amphritea sp. 2_MG-2023]|uniref:GntR family transcriptional regulator n=1 Tax=Amphritea TaxID=515417 RepID=UPI001C07768C|nr:MULTISPECIES: GntR family transcriptional regulator [Amphritea]MBU2967092.1 GntR family transcriptional regulator [Amphritea atlantica]MDO6419355.1 GntR family transcriptional regulator [Amphritea sp. 2_MG-2023]